MVISIQAPVVPSTSGWLPNRREIQIKIGFKMGIQHITSINFLFSLSFSLVFTCESTDVCLKGKKSMTT